MKNVRNINNIPEGFYHASNLDKYGIVDCPDEKLGDGCTREWFITYADKDKHWEEKSFLVHAKDKEGAFEHFISLFPETYVRAVKYYGIYF